MTLKLYFMKSSERKISQCILPLTDYFFYLQIYYSKCLNLTPCYKKKPYVKIWFDLFLLQIYNRSFLVSEVPYKRSCSTKGAAQGTTFFCIHVISAATYLLIKTIMALFGDTTIKCCFVGRLIVNIALFSTFLAVQYL